MSENIPETPVSPVRPSSGVLDDVCTCEEWAKKIDFSPAFYEKAVTFHCRLHGKVTIDGRPLPRPLPPPNRIHYRNIRHTENFKGIEDDVLPQ